MRHRERERKKTVLRNGVLICFRMSFLTNDSTQKAPSQIVSFRAPTYPPHPRTSIPSGTSFTNRRRLVPTTKSTLFQPSVILQTTTIFLTDDLTLDLSFLISSDVRFCCNRLPTCLFGFGISVKVFPH